MNRPMLLHQLRITSSMFLWIGILRASGIIVRKLLGFLFLSLPLLNHCFVLVLSTGIFLEKLRRTRCAVSMGLLLLLLIKPGLKMNL
ncbi:hypothetical protein BZA77DRAFT_321092 [Pyronema omphalodes]|nr:hypothetical protein BZA77DRAFT_321092 [Pyronema omphalodes]